MENQIEREIIASLLAKPTLFHVLTLNARWFSQPMYQQIFHAIQQLDGRFDSIFDVARVLIEAGHEEITASQLSNLKAELVTTEHFRHKVQQLERCFLEKNLRALCYDYSQKPKQKTLATLLDYSLLLQEKSNVRETGELTATLERYQAELFAVQKVETIKSYRLFDQMLGGLSPGMLFTIGARPSVGKTAFAAVNLVLTALAKNTSLAVDIFTLEMTKKELLQRFLAHLTQIDGKKLRDPALRLTPDQIQKVQDALQQLADYELNVYDRSFDLLTICQEIRQHVNASGQAQHLVVIDYLGLITVPQSGRLERRLQIEEITRQLKLLANELGIAIVLLSQLNREIEARAEKIPVLSDLRESGSIEQDSNVVGFLYPTVDQPGQIQFIFRKNREGGLARRSFNFDGATMTFTEQSG